MRLHRWRLLTALIASLLAITAIAPALAAWPVAPMPTTVHGIDPADMDLSADPAEDFFRFANGGWLDRTEIPADDAAYGVFNELDDLTTQQLLTILAALAGSSELQEGSDEWKAVQFFAQGTDLETRDAQGVEPIQPLLDEVAQIDDLEELHVYLQGAGFRYLSLLLPLFSFTDLADSSVYAAYLAGPFLGMPNRDYYLEDDEANAEVREAYKVACAELLMAAGYDEAGATAAAEAVYEFERTLAEPTLTREEQQDFSLLYNPTSIADLQTIYPLMDWDAFLAENGLTGVEQLIVLETRYLAALGGIVKAAPIETIRAYIDLEIMWSFADYLSAEIGAISFGFYGTALAGVTERDPLEERVLGDVNFMLGQAVGKVYVDEYFPPEAKEQITNLVEFLIGSFRERLEANTWMSAETKAKALEKLKLLGVKVGYPDTWRSYEAVNVEDSYAMSALSALRAEYERTLNQVGEPVDKTEWSANPQEVNAFYSPFNNEIIFPAAILQPPFFDYQADPASNFGAIGFVIGHEITHGFDLGGSQFDGNGNLANWWTEEDNAAFQALNDEVVAQYGAIEVLPDVFVDGQITVTENVADMGGVQVAFDALQTYLEANGDPGEIDGFSQDERFFLAAATVWREKIRDEALETQVKTDEHSPAAVRATQPIRNMDDFFTVFGIEAADPMYLPPDERVVIW